MYINLQNTVDKKLSQTITLDEQSLIFIVFGKTDSINIKSNPDRQEKRKRSYKVEVTTV